MKLPTRTQLRSTTADALRLGRALALARSSRCHPQVDGSISVQGAQADIEVVRDAFGVPHIRSMSDVDALFGLGFVHAQDRLFQLDSTRRFALGRLAEVAGAGLVESDRFLRRLGLADRAGRDYARLGQDERTLLDAYARGVNAGIAATRVLPPEYALLEAPPEPWHPEHTLALARLVLFTFALNWDTELLRERLLTALGPARAFELDAVHPEAYTTTGLDVPAADRVLHALEAAFEAGLPVGGASNAWALAASRTTTGAPLLASDPHLQARMPSFFHVSHVTGATFDAVGAGIVGIPGIVLGHNGALAWGITAGMADVADCYIERVDPAEPARYLTPEGWQTGRSRIERIGVKGGDTVEERVLETRHGPVIGPVIPSEARAVALRCTALEEGDLTTPFIAMLRAQTPEAFDRALEQWPGSTFNFVWAARSGDIGYRMAGSVPRRAHGEGLLPQDGTTSTGPPPPLAPHEMPRVVNPPSGIVVSANNAPGGEAELGAEWCDPYRAERIVELLHQRERHSVAALQRMQVDVYSTPLVRLRDLLLGARALEGVPAELVTRWDGQAAADSAAAAILELTYIEVARALVVRLAGEHADIVLGRGLEAVIGSSSFHYRLPSRIVDVLEQPRAPWFDSPEERDRLLRAAAARAVNALSSRAADPHGWRWGTAHTLKLAHPLSRVPVAGRLFSRGPLPVGGDVNTIAQGGFSLHRGPAAGGFSPAYRQVIDLAAPDRSTFSLPGGNSGIPGHPRYDDALVEFMEGRQRPLLYSPAAIERHTEHRLRLVAAAESTA
ncbi:MAG: penicillin acylase family protein [Dehalococcoidia bacterium]|nr:penicillin acylase family protein [Dehalococcoidia bacterium]